MFKYIIKEKNDLFILYNKIRKFDMICMIKKNDNLD